MARRYLKKFTKDPSEVLRYPINWAPWLAGDTIIAAVSIPDPGITVLATTFTTTGTVTKISGGTDGVDYYVAVHPTTAGGDQPERSLLFRVRNR